jgi:hypothetical protein
MKMTVYAASRKLNQDRQGKGKNGALVEKYRYGEFYCGR